MDRRNLKVLRARHGLNIGDMAKKIGVSRSTYAEIESGKRGCSQSFLNKLQSAFYIPDAEMWELTKIYEESEE